MEKTSESTKLTLFLILRSISAINIKSGNKIPGFQKRKNMVSLCIQTAASILQMGCANKANQHGSLKALRKKHATLLTPSYWRR